MGTKITDPDIINQIETAWSRALEPALIMKTPLRAIGIYNTNLQGSIPQGGDKVRASQVIDDGGQADQRSINDGTADSWNAGKLKTRYVDLEIDDVVQDAIEWDKYIPTQTILNPSAESIELIANRMARRINNTLYSKVAPDTAYTSIAALDADELKKGTIQSMKDYWPEGMRKWLLVSPDYYGDLLGEEKFINLDYNASGSAVPLGILAKECFGWTVVADNSRTGRTALGVNANWLYYAEAPMDVTYYDLSSKREKVVGVMMDMAYGSVLSNNGSKLHYTWNS
jgi:hypothetical protein